MLVGADGRVNYIEEFAQECGTPIVNAMGDNTWVWGFSFLIGENDTPIRKFNSYM